MRHELTTSATAATAVRAACLGLLAIVIGASPTASAAESQHIENRKAIFAALDKVTARISKQLEIKLGETVRFGALKVTPYACYSRPPTEPPMTSTFVQIDEVLLDGKEKRIFSGWMFAESPGLHALEHPVFDIWLTGCADPMTTTAPQTVSSGARGQAPAPLPDDETFTHRRFRPRR